VAAPRNARRNRLADGSEVATYSLADALADPTCWRPAVLRASGVPAVVRRTPAARPAARRPRARRRAAGSRAGPDDDSGQPEPPGDLAGGRLNKITRDEPLLVRIGRDFTAAGIAPDAQLVRLNASPEWLQSALCRDLREHIDRERAT